LIYQNKGERSPGVVLNKVAYLSLRVLLRGIENSSLLSMASATWWKYENRFKLISNSVGTFREMRTAGACLQKVFVIIGRIEG
jgi:hypothetical protein